MRLWTEQIFGLSHQNLQNKANKHEGLRWHDGASEEQNVKKKESAKISEKKRTEKETAWWIRQPENIHLVYLSTCSEGKTQ